MMARRAIWILAGLVVLLGLGHLALTFAIGRLSLNALWFAGSGIAIVLAGLINLAALRAPAGDRLAWAMALIANLALLGFVLVLWPLASEPQVALAAALFAVLTILTLRPVALASRSRS